MKKTRIMLLTQWFDPEPTFKGLPFARELVKKGFEVEVVTGFPNYPGGKLYPGYKLRWLQREVIDGVHITRVPLYPSHDGSALKRIANYLSFGFSSLVYGLFRAKRPDVIYAYHPPLTTGISALFLRLFRRVPVVYDIQDMWPDTLAATGMLNNKKLLARIGRVCNWVYKHMDRIIVLSPGFKRLLVERGVSADKIEVIYNWCDENSLSSSDPAIAPQQLTAANRFRIMFAGNMGQAQGLGVLLDSAERVRQIRADIDFIFLGSGIDAETLKKRADEKCLDNVIFIPRVPMQEVGVFLKAADALVVHLKDDPLFSITIPSKTQAYMAIGKPILMAVKGDAADLVETAGCGVIATPEDVESITLAVLKLAEMQETERQEMAEKGKAFYFDKLSLESGVERFAEQFKLLLAVSAK